MSTPEKKVKSSSTLNPSLPDDMLLHIVSRIPRLYYPTLSLVSKSFRSLIASPELYKIRSILGHTESCLYICLNTFSSSDGPSWFILRRKLDTNETNKKKTSSGFVLAKLPIPKSPHAQYSTLVTVGSDIYNIGMSQSMYNWSVSILDCRFHTWREAPNFPVELCPRSARVFDRKIYVRGIYKDKDSSSFKNLFKVFDTKSQVWDLDEDMVANYSKEGRCMDLDEDMVANYSKEGRCMKHHMVGPCLYHRKSISFCEIENVLYAYLEAKFSWYDTKVKNWRDLKGLVGLPKFPFGAFVRLADYGGNIAVLWNVDGCPYYGRSIRCAEIELKRRNGCEIWGDVVWYGEVLRVSTQCSIEKALAVTV